MDSILKAVVHLFLLLMPKTTTLTPWLNWTWQFHELTVPTLTLNVKCLFIKLMGFQMIPKWRHREIFTRKVEFRWKLLAFSLGKVLIQFCMVKFAVDLVLPTLLKFMFSKKATNSYKIFTVNLTLTTCINVKLTGKISSIFVAFLENMNFKRVSAASRLFWSSKVSVTWPLLPCLWDYFSIISIK